MSLHLWAGFALASLVMGLIPGPGVMTIVGHAIGSGRRTALASVAGMAVGNMAAMSLSLAGAGALLAASATAFSALKWGGALYLVALGAATVARGGIRPDAAATPTSPRAAFVGAVAVGVFHPKTIVFFLAFAPQFISPEGGYAMQAAVLTLTFGLLVGCTDAAYALAAARARRLAGGSDAARWASRAGGGVLIAAGLATAAGRD